RRGDRPGRLRPRLPSDEDLPEGAHPRPVPQGLALSHHAERRPQPDARQTARARFARREGRRGTRAVRSGRRSPLAPRRGPRGGPPPRRHRDSRPGLSLAIRLGPDPALQGGAAPGRGRARPRPASRNRQVQRPSRRQRSARSSVRVPPRRRAPGGDLMKTSSRRAPANAIDIVRELRAASSFRAPASLLPEVLRRVGLADLYWKLESPVGPVYVAATRAGLSMVSRARSAEEFARRFESQRGRPISPPTSRPPAAVRALMKNLKCRDREKLQFDLRGLSEFERAVLMKALEIPGGEIRPYSWIAREIGHPEAVRAVGTALGKNPVPLLIP